MTLPIIIAASLTLVLLLVGGRSTNVGPWYRDLRKPSWNPHNWAFGPSLHLVDASTRTC